MSESFMLRDIAFDPVEPWGKQAACGEQDPAMFESHDAQIKIAAKEFCKICVVVEECLADAMEHEEAIGIWGGLDQSERKALRIRNGVTQVLVGRERPILPALAVRQRSGE